MNTNLVSTTEIQRNFKEVIERLISSSEPLIVVRDSKPTAVMLSFAEYKRLTSLEKNILKRQMEEVLAKLAIANKNVSDEELDADIAAARHATRRR